MPVTTQRFPTTRSAFTSPTSDTLFSRKSLLGHHNSTASDSIFRRSSFGTYRCLGDDTTSATTSSRFGVSTRYTSSSSSTSTPSSSSSLTTRLSIDREFRKPPTGLLRLRSDSRSRDLSVDRSYLTSKQNDSLHSNQNHSNNNSKRSSSLARSIATSGADLYEKYSVANYKPKCELSRSRSLTDSTANKLVDSISSNSNSHSASNRAASRDRALCGGHLNKRETSPISISVSKVKTCGKFSGALPVNSKCLTSDNSNNNKNNSKNNNNAVNGSISVAAVTNNSHNINSINNNFNNNNLNNKKTVAISSVTTSNTKVITKKTTASTSNVCIVSRNSLVASPSTRAFTVITTITTTPVSTTPQKSIHIPNTNTIDTTVNSKPNNKTNSPNFNTSTQNALFKKRLGTNPLAPYNNPDFLKCEYDLARSQVINSNNPNTHQTTTELKTSAANKNDKNNNSININSECIQCTDSFNKVVSVNTTDMNQNKLSLYDIDVNNGTVSQLTKKFENVKLLAKPIESKDSQTHVHDNNRNYLSNGTNGPLDDIKFIDSDESERRHSPTVRKTRDYFNDINTKHLGISTLPTPSIAAKIQSEVFLNKYNTIGNTSQGFHQLQMNIDRQRSISPSSAIKPQKAIMEDLMSSTSSSTSTLSAADSSLSLSQPVQKQLVKETEAENPRSNSLRSELPPTPSRFLTRDRDVKTSPYSSSRTIADSDSFSKSLASSSISDKSDDTAEGLCGLRNIGNTCFMNSIIQCLSHTKDLTRSLKSKSEVRTTKDPKDARIVNEFMKLIKEMWSGSSRSVTPSELKSAFSSKHRMYSGCAQQDAQEFLRFFLDALHCALNTGTNGEKLEIDDNLPNNRKADLVWDWYSKVENSIIKDLFVGQLKSSLKCTTCGNTSVTFDPFWDLSVPLPTSSRCKLESCLDLFIKEEILDGDEMPTCAKCKTRRKSTKTFTIQRFPKYLAIHLKRFSETRWSKLSNLVEFPTGERELNMAPYAANSTTGLYSLYGICNHMGSTAGGHYVAVCKHPVTRKWHEFNDNAVSSTSESGLVSSSAYVLFYERV